MKIRIFLMIAVVTFAANSAWAATYYVATNGNDGNPGTLAAPFKTFERAIAPLQPGDSLYIRGGTYTERMNFQTPDKSGTANGWITVAGYQGETVILQWADTTPKSYGPIQAVGDRGYFIFENLTLDGVNSMRDSTWNLRDGNHHFILRNLDIKNFKASGLRVLGHDIQVIKCKIHDQTQAGYGRLYGIYISYGDNILIEGNEIYNNIGGGIHTNQSLMPVVIPHSLIISLPIRFFGMLPMGILV